MKILNLYAGIGGNRRLWGNKHDITAIEYKPEIAKIYKDFFPKDKVIVADAHQYLLDHFREFDFIWSSPPCPSHSRVRFGLGFCSGKVKAVYPDMKLYEEIILLDKHFGGKWCVENVMAYYKPLIEPQKIGRHWYWSNFYISDIKVSSSKISQQSKKYSKSPVRIYKASDFEKLYNIDLSKYAKINKRLLLRNCVEPETGLHIFQEAFREHSKLL
ncbi:MAG: DNA cytosine methyltransferase [Nanoarchaeota archaeon]|nr:DNA cytosine methyltransferase [Nanoarchaeota archaeon]